MNKSMNIGGNPVLDRLPAMRRFSNIVFPIFEKQGYVKLKNSQTLYNENDNTILIVTSSPSQISQFNDLKQRVKNFRKSFGQDVKIFLVYTRKYSEWSDKPVYQNTLRRILKIGTLSGIWVGLDNIETLVRNVNRGENFFNIQ